MCQYCNASFVQSGNLKTHIKRAHHADMVSSMNLVSSAALTVAATNSISSYQSRPGDGEGHTGVSGSEVSGGAAMVMDADAMDLVEVVDLFAH